MLNTLRRWWNCSYSKTAHPKDTNPQRLTLEVMESREVPAATPDNLIAIPFYGGVLEATVELVDAATLNQRIPTITPFPGYRGPTVAATGDVNRDGVSDVIVGAQAPNGHVKVFDGTSGGLLQSFFTFAGFNGAVNVASADVNGDQFADVLVTANATNGHVKAFSGQSGGELESFFAFPGFAGQTSVAGADFNFDGFAEIIVGAGGPGVGGRVAFFDAAGTVLNPGFFAFPGYSGAINIASDDITGDGVPDVVVSAGDGVPGGSVAAYSGTNLALFASFVPYSSVVTTGIDIRLADVNYDGRSDILTFVADGAYPYVAAFDGLSGYQFWTNTTWQGSYIPFPVIYDDGPVYDSGAYVGGYYDDYFYGYDYEEYYYEEYYYYDGDYPIGGWMPDFGDTPPPDFGYDDPYSPDEPDSGYYDDSGE